MKIHELNIEVLNLGSIHDHKHTYYPLFFYNLTFREHIKVAIIYGFVDLDNTLLAFHNHYTRKGIRENS